MKKLAIGIVSIAFALVGCSKITMLRTEEMKAVGTDVQTGVQQGLDSAVLKLSVQNDSLMPRLDPGLPVPHTRRQIGRVVKILILAADYGA